MVYVDDLIEGNSYSNTVFSKSTRATWWRRGGTNCLEQHTLSVRRGHRTPNYEGPRAPINPAALLSPLSICRLCTVCN
ncbi:hypothetical protein J6590_022318 [Homalodisca vitripennis]|nr:hypothetical protein J6590_022318 [Homalodisca vitripennis]